MAASCRSGDLLGRLGGEEFLAVFPDGQRPGGGSDCGPAARAVERRPVAIPGGAAVPVTISGGLLALDGGGAPACPR